MEDRNIPEGGGGDLLGALLADPEKLRALVGGIVGSAKSPPSAPTENKPAESALSDGLSAALSDPALMQKLPQMIALLRPMLQEKESGEKEASPGRSVDCRDELLLALKPFLSKERCEAVDTIIRLSHLGNVLKNLHPGGKG